MRLLAFAAALALVACDSGADPVPPSDSPGFTAEVSGAFSRAVTGQASTAPLGGTGISVQPDEVEGTITVLQLTPAEGDDRFFLAGFTAEALQPGTYEIGGLGRLHGAEVDGFIGVYRFPVDGRRPSESIALSDSGTVTITRADDEVIAGAFAFEARAVTGRDEGGRPTVGTLSVEGEFVADVREVDRAPATR